MFLYTCFYHKERRVNMQQVNPLHLVRDTAAIMSLMGAFYLWMGCLAS